MLAEAKNSIRFLYQELAPKIKDNPELLAELQSLKAQVICITKATFQLDSETAITEEDNDSA